MINMKIYKLKYDDRNQGITDLIDKGVYVETEQGLHYGSDIHAVVEIGRITLEDATYDEDFNIITPPIYVDGYHFDVMCEQEIEFGDFEVLTNKPKYSFMGH